MEKKMVFKIIAKVALTILFVVGFIGLMAHWL